ncbi:hypothetical protein CPC197_1822, partial [Chlamydia psittaci C1/97]
LIHFTVLQLSP